LKVYNNLGVVPLKRSSEKYVYFYISKKFAWPGEPFWDMLKNEGLQIFVKMDFKFSTYGPEHKTERFRSISRLSLIFGIWLKLAKLMFFYKNSYICSSGKIVKEIFQYPSYYDFYFLWVQKIKLLQKFGPCSSVIDAGGSWAQQYYFSNIMIFTNHSKCRNLSNQHIFWLFFVFGI
jgi:hypothetical protein